ncbi:MAG TPA: metallophosphoesterase family protein [Chloroflexota bacterium]|nr:metallophosphoesterase family protein [Chloroflexota bacterium]
MTVGPTMGRVRVAAIADIHGNLTALEAVIADLAHAGVTDVVCLGDVAATGPQPHQTVTRLRVLGCPVVMGNTDCAALRPLRVQPRDEEGRRFMAIDQWCDAQLTPEDLAYMRTFQPTVGVPLGPDATLLCFHGSPRDNTEGIVATTPDPMLGQMLAGRDAAVLACGHTHAPFVRRYRQGLLLNPGSAGLPYELAEDGVRNPPWAEYGIVDWHAGAVSIELRRVPIDAVTVVRTALASGMPHAEWWASGWR